MTHDPSNESVFIWFCDYCDSTSLMILFSFKMFSLSIYLFALGNKEVEEHKDINNIVRWIFGLLFFTSLHPPSFVASLCSDFHCKVLKVGYMVLWANGIRWKWVWASLSQDTRKSLSLLSDSDFSINRSKARRGWETNGSEPPLTALSQDKTSASLYYRHGRTQLRPSSVKLSDDLCMCELNKWLHSKSVML